ncbi:MAG: Coenzyme F420 hydrogenase/dehydrogenase, beta subunit C-terminal domain [Nitrososphaerota archaeon]|nr:Coenzyme F420 hydrogenase/dehydrogenase, beta subunit C-terminal domain [Nitrososphaerota archaeon]
MTSESDPSWFHGWYQGATHEPFAAVQFLMSEIVEKDRCIGCAACVQVCPVEVFDYIGDKPVDARHDGCVYCGLCAAVCPPAHLGSGELAKFITPDGDDVGFGRYKLAVLARSKQDHVLSSAQDGGISSSILIEALESGMIDGVALGDTVEGEPLNPIPKLATTKEEILHCSGSRYTYSPNTVALREAFGKDMKIAVVGVPCQINGLRHIQYGPSEGFAFANWFRKNIAFSIGLFCSEVFTYEGLQDLSKTISVPLEEIKNINVKGKIVSKTRDGRTHVSSLKNMRKYMRHACNYCWDYSADLADISLGGIGQDGWTFTVVRTDIGLKLYERLLAKNLIEVKRLDSDEEAVKAKQLLIKLSTQKRNRPKSYNR